MFRLKHLKSLVLVVAGLIALSGCSGLSDIPLAQISTATGSTRAAVDDPIVDGRPILVYSHIARNIKRCWLNPKAPLLKNYVFFAKAKPDQKGGEATITINEAAKDGKRGLIAFRVDFTPADAGKTNVQVHNVRFPVERGQKLVSDVRFWSHGQLDCAQNQNNNKITSIPPGTTISQFPAKK